MTSKELNELLVKKLPEIKHDLDLYIKDQDGMETGSHMVFEMVVVPFLIKADVETIIKAFTFFEEMATSNNEYELEVLQLSLLESLKANYEDEYDFTKYMKPATLEIYKKLTY